MSRIDCEKCEHLSYCNVPYTYECDKMMCGLVIEKGNKTINVCLPDLINLKTQVQYVLNDDAENFTKCFMDDLIKNENMIIDYNIIIGMTNTFLEIIIDFDMSFKRITTLIQPLILELRQEKYMY